MANISVADYLLSLLSPRSAEAKIITDPETTNILSNITKKAEVDRNDYLYGMYKAIIDAAERRPEVVDVIRTPNLERDTGNVGFFTENPYRIKYDASKLGSDPDNTLAHELTHFLSSATKLDATIPEQHELIKGLLGTDTYKSAKELKAMPRPIHTPLQRNYLKQLLGK